MHHDIVALDIAGTPVRWIGAQTAAGYYASGEIAWERCSTSPQIRQSI